MTSAVDHFAPGASDWVKMQLQTDLAPNATTSVTATKRAGKNAVTLTRSAGPNGELNMVIQPWVLTQHAPGSTGSSTTTTTS
jgi:hypothetical protein